MQGSTIFSIRQRMTSLYEIDTSVRAFQLLEMLPGHAWRRGCGQLVNNTKSHDNVSLCPCLWLPNQRSVVGRFLDAHWSKSVQAGKRTSTP